MAPPPMAPPAPLRLAPPFVGSVAPPPRPSWPRPAPRWRRALKRLPASRPEAVRILRCRGKISHVIGVI